MERKKLEEQSSRRPKASVLDEDERKRKFDSDCASVRSRGDFRGIDVSLSGRSCESRARLDNRDGDKYNQRTKRADNILDVATRWPSKEEFFLGLEYSFFPQDCPQNRLICQLFPVSTDHEGPQWKCCCNSFLIRRFLYLDGRVARCKISGYKPKQLWHCLNP